MKRLARTTTAALVATTMLVAAPASGKPEAPQTPASWTAVDTIGASDVWADGVTGEGVGIALVDTGVSPRPELQDAVVGQIEIGPPGRRTDGHGHGTFLAGLMASRGGDGVATGVAPGAHVVSFKVADAEGATSIEQVVAALGAVRMTADDLGIQVVVLAIGGPADEVADPVERALEELWASGLVVVVASGNDGDELTEPGTSPYLVTAGATNDQGTADRSDDELAPWSGQGLGRDGAQKPEVLAPGTSVVSSRVPGSLADRENRGSRIGGHAFRGSGTSMAAAITAGAAALLLDAHPGITNDEVKGRLMASASVDGTGTIHVPTAIAAADAVANTTLPELEPTDAPAPEGELAEFPVSIDLDPSWEGRSWIGRSWIGRSWIGRSWIELSWDGRSWIGRSWIDEGWVGRSWIGRSWIESGWTGSSWVAHDWR